MAPELLQAAECVLVRNGKAGLTVRTVAAEADVAPMGVYNWLGGKVGLVAALLLIGSDRLSAAMERNDGRDVGPRLRVCCLRYREFALANPELYEIMFEGFTSRGHGAAGARRYAAACFGVLVRNVELAAAADALTVQAPAVDLGGRLQGTAGVARAGARHERVRRTGQRGAVDLRARQGSRAWRRKRHPAGHPARHRDGLRQGTGR